MKKCLSQSGRGYDGIVNFQEVVKVYSMPNDV